MKAAFFETEEWEREYLKKSIKGEFFAEPLTGKNCSKAKDYEAISVFIYSKIDKKIISRMPKLRLIATRSTGYDHIDVKECARKGIVVANVPSYGENTVAEHAFGLLLSLSRKIHMSYVRTSKGGFSTEGLMGFDLKGKTIGIVGTGRIGMHAIRMAKGFEMNVIAYDSFPNRKAEKEMGFRYVKLDELLKNSDIISLHVPLLKETFHMINRKNITKIRKGAILINTARGGLVETDALLEGLDKGILAAAGLDVLEEENEIKEEKQLLHKNFSRHNMKTLLENHVLMEYENVLLTPHNAFNSREAIQRIMDTTLENIKSYYGRKAVNKVN